MKSLVRMMCLVALLTTAGRGQAGVINGDFQTGDFAGWTTFTTANGTIGTPAVVAFDTTGIGASLAARFSVGEATFDATQQGGGIFQSMVVSTPGDYSMYVDIAAERIGGAPNGSAGLFSLLLNGVVVDSHDFGGIFGNTTVRSSLATTVTLGAGTHEFRVLITRPFTAPFGLNQYVDNARFDLVSPATVPEPSSIAILGIGALGMGLLVRRKK